MASDFWSCDDEAIACFGCANNIIRSPNIAKVRAVNKVAKVACVCGGIRAGAFVKGDRSASNDAVNGPRRWLGAWTLVYVSASLEPDKASINARRA